MPQPGRRAASVTEAALHQARRRDTVVPGHTGSNRIAAICGMGLEISLAQTVRGNHVAISAGRLSGGTGVFDARLRLTRRPVSLPERRPRRRSARVQHRLRRGSPAWRTGRAAAPELRLPTSRRLSKCRRWVQRLRRPKQLPLGVQTGLRGRLQRRVPSRTRRGYQ